MKLRALPLNNESFSPYGQVLSSTGPVPQRMPYAGNVFSSRPGARPNLTYMSLKPAPAVPVVTELEKHPHSHQLFVPMNGTKHLIVVCPSLPGGEPDLDGLLAFTAGPGQAVNYDPDVWHAPRTVLAAPGEFVMLRWDMEDEQDALIHPLNPGIEIVL